MYNLEWTKCAQRFFSVIMNVLIIVNYLIILFY